MISTTLFASFLAGFTVVVHAAGFSLILRHFGDKYSAPPIHAWAVALLLIRVTLCLILIHVAEIAAWGFFYVLEKCLPDAETAFYFSGITYTTVGYGDLVLPKQWRMFAPVEALTGILMCGLSTALFFALLNRIYVSRFQVKPK
jgi:hypothetical protein